MTINTQKLVIIAAGPTGPTGTMKGVNILGAFTGMTGTFAQWKQATGATGPHGTFETVYNIGATGIKGQHKTVIIPGFSGGGGGGTTFDPASVLNVTLSNGNLTGANTSANFPTGCKGLLSSAKSAGLLYFEATGLNDSGGSQAGMGVNSFNSTYDQQVTQGGAGGGIDLITKNNGAVFANGSNVGSLGTGDIIATDVIACAVDMGHLMVWFKNLTQNSSWNGNGGNPATNTGGFAITATPVVPFFGWGGSATLGVAFTGNFIGPFVGALPAGFSPWN